MLGLSHGKPSREEGGLDVGFFFFFFGGGGGVRVKCPGLGFRVQGFGFRVKGLRFRVKGVWFDSCREMSVRQRVGVWSCKP